MENEFENLEDKEKRLKREYIRDLKSVLSEPSFKMWLRKLLTDEIKRQNEDTKIQD